jgi:hypothetical protein
MDDGGYLTFRDQAGNQRIVAGLADDEGNAARYRPFESGGQIVEHDDALAAFDEGVNHVAADITGAASDQDCHRFARAGLPIVLTRMLNSTLAADGVSADDVASGDKPAGGV